MRKLVAGLTAFLWAGAAFAGPTFILNDAGGAGPGTEARKAFELAASRFAGVISDDVAISINVGFTQLSSGILGSTGTMNASYSYASVRSALNEDATSRDDQQAVSTLPTALSFLSNEPGNCFTGVGCKPATAASRTLDSDGTFDNLNLQLTSANAKALGLTSTAARDASITFSSRYKWDFDPSNGITKGMYDFVGIAAHEIAHALGFASGVDSADLYIRSGLTGLDNFAWGMPLDLFRYDGGQRAWTVAGTPCLSLDAGASCVEYFSTGTLNGDKYQASHWKKKAGIGLMIPAIGTGTLLNLASADARALDVIGWDLSGVTGGTGTIQWGTGALIKINGSGKNAEADDEEGTLDSGEDGMEYDTITVPAPGGAALLAPAFLLMAARRRSRRS